MIIYLFEGRNGVKIVARGAVLVNFTKIGCSEGIQSCAIWSRYLSASSAQVNLSVRTGTLNVTCHITRDFTVIRPL